MPPRKPKATKIEPERRVLEVSTFRHGTGEHHVAGVGKKVPREPCWTRRIPQDGEWHPCACGAFLLFRR